MVIKESSIFSQLDLMMLPSTERTLIFEDELMLTDNIGYPPELEPVPSFVTSSSYPFKLMFTLVMCCTKGHMRVRLNLMEYELKANGVLIAIPNSIGECLEISSDFQVAVLAISGNSLPAESNPAGSIQALKFLTQQALLHLSDEELEEFLSIYNLMRRKIQQPNYAFTREALKGYMQVLFCNGYNTMVTHGKAEKSAAGNRQQMLFDTFLEQVQKHYTRQRSISYYANALCITPKYLSQAVYKVSGRYAGEWIKDYVILEAKALLKSKKYTVQQVSDLLDFANVSFFGKYFKAAVGCSPRKYQMG
ncbi:MAG: helix-turn-helix domain-containing protein [Bacteroidales bacterium]|nr:helix-turn-helix domain-containing protein [Bacteroidales bacterium]